jgi:hypothetical protein
MAPGRRARQRGGACEPLAVESDAVNFFLPFRRLEPNHENQLTSALLVVLRYSVTAHAAWLRLVAPERQLQEFRTQTRAVRYADEEDEPAALVSVFLTPEAPRSGGDGVITESDRTQVLDAVVDYGGELLVVIENKVAEADDRQAREINLQGGRIRLTEGARARHRSLARRAGGVHRAARTHPGRRGRGLAAGRLPALHEDYFPDLGPFRTLRLAHGNWFRQTRRLRQLLGEAVDLDATIDYYGPYIETPAGEAVGRKTYLRMTDDEQVELALYPADTLRQARAFFTNPAAVAGVARLREQPGWHV